MKAKINKKIDEAIIIEEVINNGIDHEIEYENKVHDHHLFIEEFK
jgi:hypothetical protein